MKRNFMNKIIIAAFIFSVCLVKTFAQETEEDKCNAFIDKVAKSYKECFGGDILYEFTPRLIDSFGVVNLEDEWAKLDNIAQTYRGFFVKGSQLFIIVYGGKTNKKGELKERTDRLVNYLTTNRMVETKKISVIMGGFREKFEFEIWVSRSEKIFPPLSPTINVESIKFKGKMKPLERELGN